MRHRKNRSPKQLTRATVNPARVPRKRALRAYTVSRVLAAKAVLKGVRLVFVIVKRQGGGGPVRNVRSRAPACIHNRARESSHIPSHNNPEDPPLDCLEVGCGERVMRPKLLPWPVRREDARCATGDDAIRIPTCHIARLLHVDQGLRVINVPGRKTCLVDNEALARRKDHIPKTVNFVEEVERLRGRHRVDQGTSQLRLAKPCGTVDHQRLLPPPALQPTEQRHVDRAHRHKLAKLVLWFDDEGTCRHLLAIPSRTHLRDQGVHAPSGTQGVEKSIVACNLPCLGQAPRVLLALDLAVNEGVGNLGEGEEFPLAAASVAHVVPSVHLRRGLVAEGEERSWLDGWPRPRALVDVNQQLLRGWHEAVAQVRDIAD